MQAADLIEYGVIIVVLLAAGALLFGQAMGQPVLLGYVETGSMQPTLDPGDGFVAIPAALTGPPEPGDVVVFEAQELQGGGLTTHRIVEETDEGYITRGDANPFTDQEGPEPPVSESQIVAEAFKMNGQVVVIENLGNGIVAIQEFTSGIFGQATGVLAIGVFFEDAGPAQSLIWIGLGLIVVTLISDSVTSNREDQRRSRRRSNYVGTGTFMFILALIVLAPATASMVIPSGTTSFDIVSSESPNNDPLVIGAGSTTTVEYQVFNDGFIPMIAVVEAGHPDVEITQSMFLVPPRSQSSTSLTIRAPESTGAYSRSIVEWRYLPILPRSVIMALHTIHPYVAVAVIDLVLLLLTLTGGIVAVGIGPIRMRSTSRKISIIQRVKRRLF